MSEELRLAQLAAARRFTPEVLEWFGKAMGIWFDAEGAVRWERCARLPRTSAKLSRARRDLWLETAAGELRVPGLSPWYLALKLSEMLDDFITRGQWHSWRESRYPPAGTSVLREALFYVAKLNDGNVLSARQIYRILAD